MRRAPSRGTVTLFAISGGRARTPTLSAHIQWNGMKQYWIEMCGRYIEQTFLLFMIMWPSTIHEN